MSWLCLIWFLPSYVLHVTLHEAAHWTVAKQLGIKARIEVWPKKLDGHWTWGRTYYDTPVTEPTDVTLLTIAPLLWALAWWMVSTAVFAAWSGPLWSRILLGVECVSPLIDAAAWCLGWWTGHTWTDAEKFRTAIGWDRRTKLLSLFLLLPMLLTSWLMYSKLLTT